MDNLDLKEDTYFFEEIVLKMQVDLNRLSQEREMLDAHIDLLLEEEFLLLQDKGKNTKNAS